MKMNAVKTRPASFHNQFYKASGGYSVGLKFNLKSGRFRIYSKGFTSKRVIEGTDLSLLGILNKH